ncbi:Xaa-Pro peptidase family protein [Nonomuraea sp. NPDC049152]|uniref:M24 family metallopeptidase n=1 Tax=Nonomuraea sp. NPDC049152 TaxID=3154350 RepID=UPI0033E8FFF5
MAARQQAPEGHDPIAALRSGLDAHGADGLLITNPVNIRYLTGFNGHTSALLVLPDHAYLVTDGINEEQAHERKRSSSSRFEVRIAERPSDPEPLASLVRERLTRTQQPGGRLGLEADHVTWAHQQRFATSWFPGAALVPTVGVVERLRSVKDESELATILRAAEVSLAALDEAYALLADEPTELEVAQRIVTVLRDCGAEQASPPIVAGGPNSSRPHHWPTGRRVAAGEPAVLDVAATVDGYCCELSRSRGGKGSQRLREIPGIVEAALQAGVARIKPGAPANEVDDGCRGLIEARGYGPQFIHAAGRSIGLHLVEEPKLTADSEAILEARQVFVVEPGIYLPGEGGSRHSALVLVTEDGHRVLATGERR